MPKIHSGLSLVWDDSLIPAFAAGSGSASPSYTTDFIAATGAGGSDANEVRKHIVTGLGDIVIAAADCGPSMIFVCALKLKSTSTVDAGIVGLLSFDFHYQKGPIGTDSEFT